MFWIWILLAVLLVVGVSVLVGRLTNQKKHRVSREEMLALKTSGALDHRKSNAP